MARILITAALPYANGYIHLGHCAGAYLPADLYARYARLRGHQVLFLCGSDEHGAPITIAAEQEGVSPQELVERYHRANAEAFARLGMSFDYYGRTTDPLHYEFAQSFFLTLLQRGYLEQREEEQFYDPDVGIFLPDRYVEGTCPNCGYEAARGDQCERCGAYYNQLELRNPRSRITGKPPVVRRTVHWYFLLSRFQHALQEYIEAKSTEWKENVVQQTRSWLRQGLSDRPITRDLDWGVPVPLPDARGKVLYVWFEALLGYISIAQRWALERGEPELWRCWWQEPETRYLAFIGKDNIVFHTLMFPAMLMAHGGYILPANVPANEFLNLEGRKFSKSRNWSIDVLEFLSDFPEEHAVDALRYTLAANLPETRDADFTWQEFGSRTNNELVAAFGNFVNRTLQFLHRYWDGRIPELSPEGEEFRREWEQCAAEARNGRELSLSPRWRAEERAIVESLFHAVARIASLYERFRFRDAVAETMALARAANKFFTDMAPWQTVVEAPELCARTLYICAQLLRSFAVVFAPVVPFAARRLWELLQCSPAVGDPGENAAGEDFWHHARVPALPSGHRLGEPRLLFAKLPPERIERQRQKLYTMAHAPMEASAEIAGNAYATVEDLQRLGLRIGRIVAAEPIPGTQKLLRLQVELGTEVRQIVAGIAQRYRPEELLGRAIVVATNLKPTVIRGVESQGMLLAATAPDGTPVLLTPDAEVPSGAEVR